jgi:twitching motility protein PilU
VLATLHANNSYHAMGRILSFYTPEARPALLSDLSSGLRAVVSQRLLRSQRRRPHPGGGGAAQHQVHGRADRAGDFSGVKEAMEKSMAEGSQTFEQDIAR